MSHPLTELFRDDRTEAEKRRDQRYGRLESVLVVATAIGILGFAILGLIVTIFWLFN